MLNLLRSFIPGIFCLLSMLVEAQREGVPPSVLTMGKTVYMERCMTCHQADGNGAQNMIPPLVKTEYVLGSKGRLIRILLTGMKGEIKVNGDVYSNEMPSHDFLTDSQLAAVLTYIRKSFGNGASAVTIGEVKKVRAANKKPQ